MSLCKEDKTCHDKFDDLVNETMHRAGPLAEDSPLVLWGVLLSTIVKHSNEQLDPQYRDLDKAVSFLHNNFNLLDMLKEAWRDQSYRKIENLGEYLYPQHYS